jgi:hypothetical protein
VFGSQKENVLSPPKRTNRFYDPSSVQSVERALAGLEPAGALSTGVKKSGREAGHSSPSSSEVKKFGTIPAYHTETAYTLKLRADSIVGTVATI